MMDVAIIIPAYKNELINFEIQSLKQCFEVLNKYPTYLVCPKKLNKEIYLNYHNNLNFIYFKENYFANIDGYNKLLLSLDFYECFKKYQYLLIYQLDSYVFKDELEYWCNLGYDYIGAPWFEGWHNANRSSRIIGVGNGGFSLRKTKSMIRLLANAHRLTRIKNIIEKFKIDYLFKNTRYIYRFWNFIESNSIKNLNEDYQICLLGEKTRWFKISSINNAIKFSFDVNPELLYQLNNKNLPFGCHAWPRYNIKFWFQFIKDLKC